MTRPGEVGRRTALGATADQGWSVATEIAAAMGAKLGWTDEQRTTELERYRQDIEATRAFRR